MTEGGEPKKAPSWRMLWTRILWTGVLWTGELWTRVQVMDPRRHCPGGQHPTRGPGPSQRPWTGRLHPETWGERNRLGRLLRGRIPPRVAGAWGPAEALRVPGVHCWVSQHLARLPSRTWKTRTGDLENGAPLPASGQAPRLPSPHSQAPANLAPCEQTWEVGNIGYKTGYKDVLCNTENIASILQ